MNEKSRNCSCKNLALDAAHTRYMLSLRDAVLSLMTLVCYYHYNTPPPLTSSTQEGSLLHPNPCPQHLGPVHLTDT